MNDLKSKRNILQLFRLDKIHKFPKCFHSGLLPVEKQCDSIRMIFLHFYQLCVGNCCEWGGNRASFGQHGAVAPLVSYLSSDDVAVHQTTTLALFQLSKDP